LSLRLDDFDYYLPQGLIAQTPAEPRDSSRLLVVRRGMPGAEHRHFGDITEYFRQNDVLVLNDTRVIPARLYGEGKTEVLLLKRMHDDVWEAWVQPGRKFKPGAEVALSGGRILCRVDGITPTGERYLSLSSSESVDAVIAQTGYMPVPPYIKKYPDDPERYQTVYSRNLGSAAAPTAGLHFTNELLERIRQKGVETAWCTLHVGLGTFGKVSVDDITEHRMHSEKFSISGVDAEKINRARANGGRVIAVGTTSVRTLETVASEDGTMQADEGWTAAYIYPGYKFKVVDAMITNFHLPKSTLIMLVSAFHGLDLTLAAYEEAVKQEYKFFSFGDAMFIY
jgi:S-adenosylmethionine:tRNA ribosyltransferase-isomerase